MSFFGKFLGTDPTTFVYPHAIVSIRVTRETMRTIAISQGRTVADDTYPLDLTDIDVSDPQGPRLTRLYSEDEDITEHDAHTEAHELSHAFAKVSRLYQPEFVDLTHRDDGGVCTW